MILVNHKCIALAISSFLMCNAEITEQVCNRTLIGSDVVAEYALAVSLEMEKGILWEVIA